MLGKVRKHARDVASKDVRRFLWLVSSKGQNPLRNHVIACLSFYAGLRAGEIANLRWRMVLDEGGKVGECVRLENAAAKKLSGRVIPLKVEARSALRQYLESVGSSPNRDELVLRSSRGGHLKTQSIINWFRAVYAEMGLVGASSHSGRRHFVTMAARKIGDVGGSLRDVQDLAGHRALSTTQLYIAKSPDAQKKVVDLI